MDFSKLREFEREFKQLRKKFRSLDGDLELLEKVLRMEPQGHPPGIVRISGLGVMTEIYKVKHFRCRALKGKGARSGIRIIYAYFPEEQRIEFAEMYYKGEGDMDCDKGRIKNYYK